ncbi:unnamed protein product [Merluccius merluccius]
MPANTTRGEREVGRREKRRERKGEQGHGRRTVAAGRARYRSHLSSTVRARMEMLRCCTLDSSYTGAACPPKTQGRRVTSATPFVLLFAFADRRRLSKPAETTRCSCRALGAAPVRPSTPDPDPAPPPPPTV